MKQYITQLVSNFALCESMYMLEFYLDGIGKPPLPGQFFTLRIGSLPAPLLRRPFAFARFSDTDRLASCIYVVRGIATAILRTLGNGTSLDIIAPLGRPFPLSQPHERPLLVAGGTGLGPILFLADTLLQRGIDCRLVFGCRSATHLPDALFENRNASLCTDDGSKGFHGTVIDYLKKIADSLPRDTVLYCCGPGPMLQMCHQFAKDHCFRCFVSVEQVMACGVGACMGCAVRLRDHGSYVRACKEGPVFDSEEVEWE